MAFPQGWLKTRKDAYSALAPLVALLLLWPVLVDWSSRSIGKPDGRRRFQQRARSDPAGDPRVIFVKMDEPSLTLLGKWPWSRSIHGRFCQLLADQNPSVVAFDILFTEPGE
jgi:CHASE2 domain-containing sensor protein